MRKIVILPVSFAGFIVLGTVQALYGPGIPAFLERFHISAASAGLAQSAHFIGAAIGVMVYAGLKGSRPVKLAASYFALGLGAFCFAFAADWPQEVAAACLIGLGFGGIDYGLNDFFASDPVVGGAGPLNMLNAFFGIGAVSAPFLIGIIGAGHYRLAFAGCAVVALFIMLLTAANFSSSPVTARKRDSRRLTSQESLVVFAFVFINVLHIGIEFGVGGWEPVHLIGLGYTQKFADDATAVFWLALTAGRLLVLPFIRFWRPETIVIACFVAMTISLFLAAVPACAPLAYAAAGLFMAPLFPTGIPWMQRCVPNVRTAMAWVLAMSMLGAVFLPPILGLCVADIGAGYIPVIMGALSVTGLLVGLMIMRAFPKELLSSARPAIILPEDAGI